MNDEHEHDDVDERPQHGPTEFRSSQLLEVRYPQRVIEVVVMPYEEEAVVEHDGRLIREVCTRGAYDGVQRRPGRIKINRDHDLQRSVGKCVTLHPSRVEGLVAEVWIAPSLLGDETLILADGGVLDASAGFAIMRNRKTGEWGERWLENRSLRRLTQCWLGHIAFTPEPAYEGANVLATRVAGELLTTVHADPVPTPNLDALRLLDLQAQFDAYGHS